MHPQVIDTTDRSGMRRPGPEPEGRVCMAHDCDWELSRYNRSEFCTKHGGWGRLGAGSGPGDGPMAFVAEMLLEEE
jgi:hypothetical protein